MADPELVQTLDYILNRCGAAEIEAVAAAVVRRKRDISLFGSAGAVDPARWAKQAAKELAGSAGGLSSIRGMVRNMAADMLRKEAPELTEDQIGELLGAWIPGESSAESGRPRTPGIVDADSEGRSERSDRIPSDLLSGMVAQFVSYSLGTMPEAEDEKLRSDLGDWPPRYWRAFPGGVRAVVGEYLKGGSSDAEFKMKLKAVLDMASS